MNKLKEKLVYGSLTTSLLVPFFGTGLKTTWAGGGITKDQAIGSICSTLINIIGGGQAANIKNMVCFALGKEGNYSNWYDLAWSIIDLVTVFAPGSAQVRLAISAGKIVATL